MQVAKKAEDFDAMLDLTVEEIMELSSDLEMIYEEICTDGLRKWKHNP